MVKMVLLVTLVVLFAVEATFMVKDFQNKKPISKGSLISMAMGIMVFIALLSEK